ncbi:MAG TPA: plastocyanin/azurin family copper-binding protein [Holophagaceae bacterium]|nr:plastocyanin/azurin family copper-binding protein [Holophagaceae bacterium]
MRSISLLTGVLGVGALGLALMCGGGGGGYGGGTDTTGTYGTGGGGTPPKVPANTVLVGVNSTGAGANAFYPSTLTVAVGTTVTWQWTAGTMTHNVTSGTAPTGDGAYFSPNQSTGTYTHQYTAAGTYPYFCSIHGAVMSGSITVQ